MGKGLNKYIKYIIECVLQVIYGNNENCVICENHIDNNNAVEIDYICHDCFSKIVKVDGKHTIEKENNHVEYYSSCYYSGVVVELIRKLKYKSDFYAGLVLAKMMVETINNEGIKFDIITYVPSDYSTIKKRGYNQSQYLASEIGKLLEVPFQELLLKSKTSKDQIGLGSFSRWDNLKDCYRAKKGIDVKGKIILLIDDVITTGATAYFCSEQLKKSGANKVVLLTGAKSSL